ncbi:MAG TPA: MmgE/PrpD family protein [Acetobacteraceae bacterium]|jgi:2-methylcitrate dehydratase PrpD|nr:MmgE/PrpD family protein [Acetobacteraceae bacterium]
MNAITDIASQGLTRALAEQARTLTYADLPEDVRKLARQCLMDYVACTLAGSKDELAAILLAEMQEQGGAPIATVIGHDARLPVLSAAIVNGASSHALDYDDVNLAMTGHPSVVLLSALLALAEERGSSGQQVLTAFVAGYELQCRLGLALAPGHYNELGFHATGTLGSFGAAAACAHLLGLDEAKFATALGIAGTQAAGLKSLFGTMCKPLHAGKAAYHGALAARLAQRGFTARGDIIECAQGFARTHSPDWHPERALAAPPRGFHILNNLFKYHAACYMTHAPIEAARRLREEHGLRPEQIARIRLGLDETCDRICNIPAPRTGLEAKFSLRLTTAMALAGVNTGGLESYSEETAADPTLIALRDKVEFDFRNGVSNTVADLELVLTDGRNVSTSYDSGVPASDIDEQGGRIAEKFTSLAEPMLGRPKAGDLLAEINRLEQLTDLRGLMRLCAV